MPETSVVIRSFNEREFIGDVLDALESQSYRDFEVVLVDSGSTDGTLDVAAPRVDQVAHIDPRNFTFGYSLNVGCETADGDFLAFLSAHAIPTDDGWLGTLVDPLRDPETAMVYSRQRGVEGSKFAEKRHFEQLFPDERKRQTPPEYFANNASSAIEKSLWERHRFDEYLTGLEDVEWAKHFMDQGYVVVYEPDACIYHVHDETWDQVFTRFEREAVAAREIGVREPRERWREYARLPKNVLADLYHAWDRGELDAETAVETALFRFNQHRGTATGLTTDLDPGEDRYELFYGGANERVVVREPGEAEFERGPLPSVRPNDVLVAVETVGLSRAEVALFEGTAGRDDVYPVVPGHEYAGRVVDTGPNVDSVSVGDRVVGDSVIGCGKCNACQRGAPEACANRRELGGGGHDGAFARYLTAPSDNVHPVPSGVDYETATLAEPLGTVLYGLEKASVGRDSACAILGGGTTGALCARLLARRGAEPTVFAGDGHPTVRHPESVAVREWPPDDLSVYDVVVETTGGQERVNAALNGDANGASVLLLGDTYGDVTLDLDTLVAHDRVVVGVGRAGPSSVERALWEFDALSLDGLAGRTVPFEDYESAWRAVSDGAVDRCVLRIDDGGASAE